MCRVLLIHTRLTYTNRSCLRKDGREGSGKKRGDRNGNKMVMIHVKPKKNQPKKTKQKTKNRKQKTKNKTSGQSEVRWYAEQTRKVERRKHMFRGRGR